MSSAIRVAVFALSLPATPSLAQAPGYVRVNFVKAGVIVGAGGGSGVLTYRGRDYPLSRLCSILQIINSSKHKADATLA